MSSQERGIAQGTRNTADMQSLVRTAEGALSSIGSQLQRLNEISIQALNDTLTRSDREVLQTEVNQILGGIQSVSDSTQFNTRNLLDGSARGLHTASSPDGSGMQVSISPFSLEALGIAGFNVTDPRNINLDALQSAMATVNSSRAELGAQSNRMDFTMISNDITQLNLAAARSRIQDTDMARAMMDLTKERVLEQYQIAGARREMEQMEQQTQRLFMF
jgi:flagellin